MNKLTESIHDKYLFKCIFLAGGAGSGKSFVADSLANIHSVSASMINYTKNLNVSDIDGLKPENKEEEKELIKSKFKYGSPVKSLSNDNIAVVNSDEVFEYFLTKNNVTKKLTFDVENPLYNIQQGIRKHAKKITSDRKANIINGMLPIIIDGTGKDFIETIELIDNMKSIGYDVTMIFVDVPKDVSLERNKSRERSLQDVMVIDIWEKCQANVPKYKMALQNDFILIDNINDIIYDPYYIGRKDTYGNDLYPTKPNPDDLVNSYKKNLRKLGRRIFSSKLKNPIGIKTLQRLKDEGKNYLNN